MRVVRAHFDGRQIVLPAELAPAPPGDVIVVFDEGNAIDPVQNRIEWQKAQEQAFGKVWDNPDDEIYDRI